MLTNVVTILFVFPNVGVVSDSTEQREVTVPRAGRPDDGSIHTGWVAGKADDQLLLSGNNVLLYLRSLHPLWKT